MRNYWTERLRGILSRAWLSAEADEVADAVTMVLLVASVALLGSLLVV